MLKGLYLSAVDHNSNTAVGVVKKINSQIKAFKKSGISISNISLHDNKIVIDNVLTDEKIYTNKPLIGKNASFFKYILKKKKDLISECDFVYIRFSIANFYLYKIVKYLYKNNKKVFIEIPTYPYKEELDNSFKNKVKKFLDNLIWIFMKKYIFRLVITNDLEYINDIRCINIINGVDIESIKFIDRNEKSKSINIIAMANLSKWHGYDRLIKGIKEYYLSEHNKQEVMLYIVGDGPERENLERLTNELNINKNVKFLGTKNGKELDEIFDIMDIGVSSLALFRAGGGHDPIKSKEYIARGIPVLLGYKDRAFKEKLDFVFEVEENDEPIDIEDLLEKYNKMISTGKDIRNYAIENLTWEKQIEKVVDQII